MTPLQHHQNLARKTELLIGGQIMRLMADFKAYVEEYKLLIGFGQPRFELIRGKDYDCTDETMRQKLLAKAKELGLERRIITTTKGLIAIKWKMPKLDFRERTIFLKRGVDYFCSHQKMRNLVYKDLKRRKIKRSVSTLQEGIKIDVKP